jgi:hypothetical protein
MCLDRISFKVALGKEVEILFISREHEMRHENKKIAADCLTAGNAQKENLISVEF